MIAMLLRDAVMLVAAMLLIGVLFGRPTFWSLIGAMTAIAIDHGVTSIRTRSRQ